MHTNSYILQVNIDNNLINPSLTITNREVENKLFYKRFIYTKEDELAKIVYLSDNKTIYNEEVIK